MKNQKSRTNTPCKIPHAGMYQAPTSTTSAASFPSQAPLGSRLGQ